MQAKELSSAKISDEQLNRILQSLAGQNMSSILRTSHLTPHTAHVTYYTPHITRHTSHVTRHTSHALQICPFPFQGVREAIDRYPNAQVSWVQVRFCFCTFVSDVCSHLSVLCLRHAPCLCSLVLRILTDHVTSIRLTAGGAEEPRRLVLY